MSARSVVRVSVVLFAFFFLTGPVLWGTNASGIGRVTKKAASRKASKIGQSSNVAPAGSLQLMPFLTGLSNPLLVTNAHDGSNRLFIVQQTGQILVLQPGSTTPTVFLDISSRIRFGGEQGLIGVTFHPRYWQNGRFYVHYSRSSDGDGTISEFRVSVGNPNVADPNSEKILLTVDQPFSNHNGGMIEFGPDGFLYIAKGDGGSANDPGNRAQNLGVMNGKILRIDVDHTAAGKNYAIPADNPFVSTSGAVPEIYAYGLRNPFRFSFDRGTGKLYAGDVGQDAWEEADIITSGGNYGWRIFEGNHCTNIDPCVSTGLIFPILEYGHTLGRCGIIGGYIYRGTLTTLPQGIYTYGDICTGEVFTFDGTTSTVIGNVGANISSFGEDESGELYVCENGAGTVMKLAPAATCSLSLGTQSATFGVSGGTGSFTVSDPGACQWSSLSGATWITVNSGGSGSSSGTLNYTVSANPRSEQRLGTIAVAGKVFKITQSAAATDYAGTLETADCTTISGWAADRNRLNTAINVEIYDGTMLVATVFATDPRPDVATSLGDNGLHGFSLPTPANLKNGFAHSVHVKFEASATELTNSPASITCGSPTPSYVGFVDHLGCDTIAGWAADRNRLNTSINVEIYDGSTMISTVPATISRPDVGASLGDNGLHGFSVATPTSLMDGASHSVHVKFETSTTELNNSPANLTCSAGTPNYAGNVDHLGCDLIAGWVADRNRLNTSINVEIYDGSTLVSTTLANISRPDVGTFLGDNGLHGFNVPTPSAFKDGAAHTVHVKFESSTTEVGGSPKPLTCSAQTPSYVGFVDQSGCNTISGWAADRNRLNTSINVEFYDGTTLIAVVAASQSRPDVGTFLGDNGLHGFSLTTPLSLKTGAAHSLHIKFETSATELSGSPANITCTASTASYAGFVDLMNCTTIAGWAADRNRLNTSISVSVYDGSTLLMTVPATISRPDVGSALGDNGLHGFSIATPSSIKTGTAHTIHVKFETGGTELIHSPGSLTCP